LPAVEQITFTASLGTHPAANVTLPPGCNAQAPIDALYTVTDIYPEHVVLDGNHPLAGIALRLSLRVSSVREATESEIGLGSAGTGFFRVTPVVAAPSDQRTLH
jgi:FKBP-type peptidyl-prolyl cis-trans isomerase SlyD